MDPDSSAGAQPGTRADIRAGLHTGALQRTAIVMAFGLALTPGLAAASRQAGGTMMAVAFLLLASSIFIARPWNNWSIVAGILGGLALLSGPAVVTGLIILALVGLFAWKYFHFERVSRAFYIALVLTILLIGSNLFRFPAGLAAWLDTIPAYLQGWLAPVIPGLGVPALRLVAALIIYQPVAVVFGLVGAVRSMFFTPDRQKRLKIGLILVWVSAALVLVLAYPARQAVDLSWVLAPLWAVAAWEIQRYLPARANEEKTTNNRLVSIIQALLLIILFGLLWYSLASISRLQGDETGRLMRYVVIIGILALGALMTILIQLGWSWEVARNGLAWGVLGGLALFSISTLWSTAYLRANLPQEIWTKSPGIGKIDLFTKTLTDISLQNTGRPDSIDIVSEVGDASMRWALRGFSKTEYVEKYSENNLPSILITRQTQDSPALLAAYRGQDFAWWLTPGWNGPLPDDFVSWLTFRNAPVQQASIILWARSDRFPGGILAPLDPGNDSSSPLPAAEDESSDSSDLIQK